MQQKIEKQYDTDLEQILIQWITTQCRKDVGQPQPGRENFQNWLKDGTVRTGWESRVSRADAAGPGTVLRKEKKKKRESMQTQACQPEHLPWGLLELPCFPASTEERSRQMRLLQQELIGAGNVWEKGEKVSSRQWFGSSEKRLNTDPLSGFRSRRHLKAHHRKSISLVHCLWFSDLQ